MSVGVVECGGVECDGAVGALRVAWSRVGMGCGGWFLCACGQKAGEEARLWKVMNCVGGVWVDRLVSRSPLPLSLSTLHFLFEECQPHCPGHACLAAPLATKQQSNLLELIQGTHTYTHTHAHTHAAAGGARRFTQRQVEEVKLVLRLLPIFATTVLYWTIYMQVGGWVRDKWW